MVGAGIVFGQARALRLARNVAASVRGGFHPFLGFRLQFGLDPLPPVKGAGGVYTPTALGRGPKG